MTKGYGLMHQKKYCNLIKMHFLKSLTAFFYGLILFYFILNYFFHNKKTVKSVHLLGMVDKNRILLTIC